jgi:hypothetical protein
METFSNPTHIPDAKVWGLMSMLNTDGGMAFQPQTCKELMCSFLGNDIATNYKAPCHPTSCVQGRIDPKMPGVIFWVPTGGNQRATAMGRINDVLTMVCEKMGLSRPRVMALENTKGAIVVFFDPYFIRASVHFHGFLTFLRGAARVKHSTVSIYKFIDSMHHEFRYGGGCADAVHLVESKDNIYNLLNKQIDCDVRGYNGWMVKRALPQGQVYNAIYFPGIVSYSDAVLHPKRECFTIQDAIAKLGNFGDARTAPGEAYMAWSTYLVRAPEMKAILSA